MKTIRIFLTIFLFFSFPIFSFVANKSNLSKNESGITSKPKLTFKLSNDRQFSRQLKNDVKLRIHLQNLWNMLRKKLIEFIIAKNLNHRNLQPAQILQTLFITMTGLPKHSIHKLFFSIWAMRNVNFQWKNKKISITVIIIWLIVISPNQFLYY